MDFSTNVLSGVWSIFADNILGNSVVGAIWTGIDRLNSYAIAPALAGVTAPLGFAGRLLFEWTQNTIGSAKVDLTIKKHELLS